MGPFLHGFTDELIKLAAFPQQHEDVGAYDAGVAAAMDQYQGPNAKTGLKTGVPLQPPAAAAKRAPTPLTTPNHMVDYASKGGGG
jgi:hypothetical protein